MKIRFTKFQYNIILISLVLDLISIIYYIYNNQPQVIFEKNLVFLVDYFSFKIAISEMSWNDAYYLTQIFKSIPFHELLQDVSKDDIKNYVDNLILMYEKMQYEIYPKHMQDLSDKIYEDLHYRLEWNTWVMEQSFLIGFLISMGVMVFIFRV